MTHLGDTLRELNNVEESHAEEKNAELKNVNFGQIRKLKFRIFQVKTANSQSLIPRFTLLLVIVSN